MDLCLRSFSWNFSYIFPICSVWSLKFQRAFVPSWLNQFFLLLLRSCIEQLLHLHTCPSLGSSNRNHFSSTNVPSPCPYFSFTIHTSSNQFLCLWSLWLSILPSLRVLRFFVHILVLSSLSTSIYPSLYHPASLNVCLIVHIFLHTFLVQCYNPPASPCSLTILSSITVSFCRAVSWSVRIFAPFSFHPQLAAYYWSIHLLTFHPLLFCVPFSPLLSFSSSVPFFPFLCLPILIHSFVPAIPSKYALNRSSYTIRLSISDADNFACSVICSVLYIGVCSFIA